MAPMNAVVEQQIDVITLVGPSGAGKSTFMERLMKEHPKMFGHCVSHTTRAPREGEEHGKQYYFISQEEFVARKEAGEFVESTAIHGAMYGTSSKSLQAVIEQGKIVLMDIDIPGAHSVKKFQGLRSMSVHIYPPDLTVLESRLRGRGTENEERIQRRMKNAVGELEWCAANREFFDLSVQNENLDAAYEMFYDTVMNLGFGTQVSSR